MTKHFCDICGQEIEYPDNASKFKVKKEVYSWHESWWERMFVHNSCWIDMCEYIREKRGKNDGK